MDNVLELLEKTGIEAKKMASTHGGEYHSACPGCGGENRFHVWPEQNEGNGSFWCRNCKAAGDSISFVMTFEGLSFPAACARLGRELETAPRSGVVRIPSKKNPRGRSYKAPAPRPDPGVLWRKKAEDLVSWSHDCLMKAPDRLSWLEDRGILADTVEKYRLGWNPGKDGKDLFRPRESWGLATELKEGRKKKLWLPIGLVIPMIDRGRVRRIRIRRPEGDPRYYVLPGSQMGLMITRRDARAYMVVEAELDAMLVDQCAGDWLGVVGLGSASAKPDAELFGILRKARVVLVSTDRDKAGENAVKWWADHIKHSKRWPVGAGKDPGEAYQAGRDIRIWAVAGLPIGWIFGRSFVDSKKREAQDPILEPSEDPGTGSDDESSPDPPAFVRDARESSSPKRPASVEELVGLLKQYPVEIRITNRRTQIRDNKKWAARNPEASKRISELVFFDEDVGKFLAGHDDIAITGRNIE